MPGRYYHILFMSPLFAIGFSTCRQPYDPPAITNPNRLLVVDGFINTAPGAITTFNLNRTRNLGDTTVTGIPELNAQFSIISSAGNSYPLADRVRNGIYTSDPLTLDITQQYHITVATADGQQFSSDPVPCEITPPIDSVFWRQPFDLDIEIASHDPTDMIHYYRYDYNETWEHDSQLQTVYGVANGMLYAVDSSTQKDRCWTTDSSSNVLLASTAAESRDVIDSFKLITIPNGDQKITKVYSILVHQYALTVDAYNYWQLIQKTTQDVGTLFDVQPTQLTGNIHCLSNPAEPVIGYISACIAQQQRIYITESSLHDWTHNQAGFVGCDTVSIPFSFANPFAYNYPDTNFAPYYFDGSALVLASRICLDCTLLGGSNIRPPFMPD
jgi:hypothetical protein